MLLLCHRLRALEGLRPRIKGLVSAEVLCSCGVCAMFWTACENQSLHAVYGARMTARAAQFTSCDGAKPSLYSRCGAPPAGKACEETACRTRTRACTCASVASTPRPTCAAASLSRSNTADIATLHVCLALRACAFMCSAVLDSASALQCELSRGSADLSGERKAFPHDVQLPVLVVRTVVALHSLHCWHGAGIAQAVREHHVRQRHRAGGPRSGIRAKRRRLQQRYKRGGLGRSSRSSRAGEPLSTWPGENLCSLASLLQPFLSGLLLSGPCRHVEMSKGCLRGASVCHRTCAPSTTACCRVPA